MYFYQLCLSAALPDISHPNDTYLRRVDSRGAARILVRGLMWGGRCGGGGLTTVEVAIASEMTSWKSGCGSQVYYKFLQQNIS